MVPSLLSDTLGEKRDHRPLHYHTPTRASSGTRFSGDTDVLADSSAESLCLTRFRFRGLFFPILRRCVRFERAEKTGRDAGYFIDCNQQRAFVCLRRFVKTADFSHELERSSSNLFGGDRRIEIEEGFDIPAHHYDPKVQNSQGTELSRVTIHSSSIFR